MPRPEFDEFIVDAAPCDLPEAPVTLHGITLVNQRSVDIAYTSMTFNSQHLDISRMLQVMEGELSAKNLTGPLVGAWATRLCAAHAGRGPVKEHFGSWFLPTRNSYMKNLLPVKPEDSYWSDPWEAEAVLDVGTNDISQEQTRLSGIVLPHIPSDIDSSTVTKAILLAQIDGLELFGFLHHNAGAAQKSFERIIPSADPGELHRLPAGKVINFRRPLV